MDEFNVNNPYYHMAPLGLPNCHWCHTGGVAKYYLREDRGGNCESQHKLCAECAQAFMREYTSKKGQYLDLKRTKPTKM